MINYNKLSQEIGISHTTVAGYYQILEECLVAERIRPFTQSKKHRRLTKSAKYIFYDLGVRRVAAEEGLALPQITMGHLFEQFVGLELLRHSHLARKRFSIMYWRDYNGPEVDYIIERDDQLIPIEVKWHERPRERDANHLALFLSEYENAKKGYIICRTPRPFKINERITAIPWQGISSMLEEMGL